MSFWKIAIVCLVVFTVAANDIDTDIEMHGDFVRDRLEILNVAIGGGARGGSSSGGSRVSASVSKPASVSKSPAPMSKPASVSKPSAPASKPSSKPSTPVTKPSTPVTKPSTPVTKPSTPGTKPSTPVTKPSTPVTKPSTPVTKPSTPSTPSTSSVANNKGYINQLWRNENGQKVGYNSKTGMWTGNAAPEKGGTTDYGPGLKLPYKQGGYSQAEIDKALTNKITTIESTLRNNVAKLGKNYDNLSDTQKKLLVDYSYNTGNAFATFPKFSKAVVNGDTKTMNAEYKRYFTDKSGSRKEIKGRNDWTKNVIDGFGK